MAYKCKTCGSDIRYDIKERKLKCDTCKRLFDVEEFGDEEENYTLRHCLSCGGEVVTFEDSDSLSYICPYCGSNVLVSTKLEEEYKPDIIIPFRVTKEFFLNGCREYVKKFYLFPDDFFEKGKMIWLQGLYIPCSFYSINAKGKIKAQKEEENRIQTLFYKYNSELENISIDDCEHIRNEIIDSVFPFSLKNSKKFYPGYILGFGAERFNITESKTIEEVEKRARKLISRKFKKSYPFLSEVEVLDLEGDITDGKTCICPIWIMSYLYSGKIYQFVMNGQTKKIMANIPYDKKKRIKMLFVNIALWCTISIFLFFFFAKTFLG